MTGFLRNYHDVPTKKALKALKGQKVTIIEPNPISFTERSANIQGTAIVGPDPYHKRTWFAQIWTDSEGKLIKVA